jgi:hypothetical protein
MRIPSRFSPATVHEMRAMISQGLIRLIPQAIEVLEGTRKWNQTQAMIFRTLLSKCVPDVNAHFVQHDWRDKPLGTLTRAELEAAAAELVTPTAQ